MGNELDMEFLGKEARKLAGDIKDVKFSNISKELLETVENWINDRKWRIKNCESRVKHIRTCSSSPGSSYVKRLYPVY